MISLLRFLRELIGALIAECRFRYYRAAYQYVGEGHPDSWLIARRMALAQLRVSDFLRRLDH